MIGVFDSGVGGLSVLSELVRLMPHQDYVYVADTRFCPYGSKSLDLIQQRSAIITEFLIGQGADVVVVACNTATAASVAFLREHYPIPFVGMEPAIKPAALLSKTGVVGVLATANTFKGSLYHHTRDTYASGIRVVERVGEGLVELVEAGQLQGEETDRLVGTYVNAIQQEGADVLVLGCTHYPFLKEAIRRVARGTLQILDPAPAIARQTQRLLHLPEHSRSQTHPSAGRLSFWTTGTSWEPLKKMADRLFPDLPDKSYHLLMR